VKDRTDMVYVGANDGMLHAFKAADGSELFAYVPEAIYPQTVRLDPPRLRRPADTAPTLCSAQARLRRWPAASADAKFTDADGNGGWRTVLVGSFGLGAQGVYALDITNPGSISQDTPSDLTLWEFTDASGSDADDGALDGRDMGYSLAPPVIVRIDDDLTDDTEPTWVALINNGYNNTNEATRCRPLRRRRRPRMPTAPSARPATRCSTCCALAGPTAPASCAHGYRAWLLPGPESGSAPLPTGNGCADATHADAPMPWVR
jgi:Tfp pilus tip-associated adhesin PilY1